MPDIDQRHIAAVVADIVAAMAELNTRLTAASAAVNAVAEQRASVQVLSDEYQAARITFENAVQGAVAAS